jgi:sugar/nucleoside kinase (ribokinase family)
VRSRGVFVGLATLDVVYGLPRLPGSDEKMSANRQAIAAGGPATGAAVAYAFLGGRPSLVTKLGTHPLSDVVKADLRAHGVEVHDTTPGHAGSPPVSSILSTGVHRAVVSVNDAEYPPQDLMAPDGYGRTASLLDGASVLVVDGHHAGLAVPVAIAARARGIPVLLDAGSWKPAAAPLLDLSSVVVCSADFRVPGVAPGDATLRYLLDRGAEWAAVSAGGEPVHWASGTASGQVAVPSTEIVDTLGAGDVLHGALAYGLSTSPGEDVAALLADAVAVASRSCQYFGTREWLLAGR